MVSKLHGLFTINPLVLAALATDSRKHFKICRCGFLAAIGQQQTAWLEITLASRDDTTVKMEMSRSKLPSDRGSGLLKS